MVIAAIAMIAAVHVAAGPADVPGWGRLYNCCNYSLGVVSSSPSFPFSSSPPSAVSESDGSYFSTQLLTVSQPLLLCLHLSDDRLYYI